MILNFQLSFHEQSAGGSVCAQCVPVSLHHEHHQGGQGQAGEHPQEQRDYRKEYSFQKLLNYKKSDILIIRHVFG